MGDFDNDIITRESQVGAIRSQNLLFGLFELQQAVSTRFPWVFSGRSSSSAGSGLGGLPCVCLSGVTHSADLSALQTRGEGASPFGICAPPPQHLHVGKAAFDI